VNLAVLHGGRELNLVPDHCRLGLDIRTHPWGDEEFALQRLERLRARHAPLARLRVQRRFPAFVTDRAHPWAARLRACGRGWATADWFCDANIFARSDIPAVAFGPGDIAQAHTADEYIAAAELEAGARAFLRFLSHDSVPDELRKRRRRPWHRTKADITRLDERRAQARDF
jgi:acetylornithine deacetylase/succinyl-diaminopimelate desuccinylase-like protein